MAESFSQRYGYTGHNTDIKVWEDAPEDLRFVLLDIVREVARTYLPGEYPESGIRDAIAHRIGKKPDSSIWYYKDVWAEVEKRVYGCEWFRVYDIMEALYVYFGRFADQGGLYFQRRINEAFIDQGIGWQLLDGRVIVRGDEPFEIATRAATEESTGRPTTQARLQEALDDLSRRPKPDFPGAIFHAFAAIESVVGSIEYTPEELRDQSNHTLGAYLQRHPNLFLSEDFKEGLKRLWRYANNEGSRHGKEGIEPAREEAEFLVFLAAALVTYVNRKHPA